MEPRGTNARPRGSFPPAAGRGTSYQTGLGSAKCIFSIRSSLGAEMIFSAEKERKRKRRRERERERSKIERTRDVLFWRFARGSNLLRQCNGAYPRNSAPFKPLMAIRPRSTRFRVRDTRDQPSIPPFPLRNDPRMAISAARHSRNESVQTTVATARLDRKRRK